MSVCSASTRSKARRGEARGPSPAIVSREEWVCIYEEDGEPLPAPTAGREHSGKFLLRTGKELHRELAVEALRVGESLNAYCVHALRGGRGRSGKAKKRARS